MIAFIVALGALLPVSAAIEELIRKRDATPLDIDARYRKDDRYFALSFEELIVGALGPAPRERGSHDVVLHRPEVIETTGPRRITQSPRRVILDVEGDLTVGDGVTLHTEALASGSVVVGDGARLRALKASGAVTLGDDVRVERWLDAGGPLRVGSRSALGARATCGDEIVLSGDVRFNTLAGTSITVGSAAISEEPRRPAERARHVSECAPSDARQRGDGAVLVRHDFSMPSHAFASGDVIARGSVWIGESAVLLGSIHSDADVTLERGACVYGSIVCERNLRLGERAVITEHAVTNADATIGRGARVGTRGRVTTLLADHHIELFAGSVVFGRVVAVAGGTTISDGEQPSAGPEHVSVSV